jgi:hypothetical protein
MKFRFGLIVGIAVGYVLGSRAGYERYQQIQSTWRSMRRSEPAQRLSTEVRDLADRAGSRLEDKANRGVDQLSKQVREDDTSTGPASSEMDRMR